MDELLLDPADKLVHQALKKAVTAANRELGEGQRLRPKANAFAAGIRDCLARPEGRAAWTAGRRTQQQPRVELAWWTDLLGRRHVRVRGRAAFGVPPDGDDHPPAWFVHPEAFAFAGEGGTAVVFCGCGAVGTPEALGWVGTSCGPCHDQRAAGDPAPGPAVQPDFYDPVAFSADGAWVFAPTADNRLGAYHPASGRRDESPPIPFGGVSRLTVAPDGSQCLATTGGNGLLRWDRARGRFRGFKSVELGPDDRPAPDGSRTLSENGGRGWRIDWQAPGTGLTRYWINERRLRPFARTDDPGVMFGLAPNPDRLAGGFWEDPATFAAFTADGRLVRIDAATGRETEPGFRLPQSLFAGRGSEHFSLRVCAGAAGWACTAFDTPGHGPVGPIAFGRIDRPESWRTIDPTTEPYDFPPAFAVSPDGRHLAVGTRHAGVLFYPTAGGEPARVRFAHPAGAEWVDDLAFSPDGTRLAVVTNREGDGPRLLRLLPWPSVLAAAQ